MLYAVGILGFHAWEPTSQVTLRELLQGGRGRSQVKEKFYPKGQVVWTSWASRWPMVKIQSAKAGDGDPGLIPDSGGGHGNLFQDSCLENPMERGVWQVTAHSVAKNPIWLKRLSTHTHSLNIKRLSLIKGSQISQVKEFGVFLYMRRCKSLGSLKPFLITCISAIWGQYPVFHIVSFLGVAF